MKRHFERRHHSARVQLTRHIVCAFATVVVALATIIGASGCSSSQNASSTYTLVEHGKLTVASDLATPPFEYVNDSGEDQGFTYELMGMIADELGLELNYLPAQKFDGIIPMVKQGVKTDVGACNITITDERKEEVDFTDPYIDSNQGVAVAKNTGYDTVDSLNAPGVKIAVQSGTTSEEWAIENLPQATTVNFDDWTAAFTAVMSGQCQAVVCDLPVEQWMVSNSFTGMEIIKEVPTGEQFGIAVSKDNPELTQAINDALAKIKSSGAYDKLYEKWFGMAPTSGSDNEDASSSEDATGASLAVTSATAKSNEDGGNGVLGGIATRLTWEATTGSDESDVSQIELELPEGGSFESTDVKVTLLDGLNQTGVKASCSLNGSARHQVRRSRRCRLADSRCRPRCRIPEQRRCLCRHRQLCRRRRQASSSREQHHQRLGEHHGARNRRLARCPALGCHVELQPVFGHVLQAADYRHLNRLAL